ncbi:MAG: pseudouridine synthase [Thermonema sp.]|jgi:23S rRNA pseudouridine2457 synthase|uniref:pseudouridine synthase n=1 Tax=Thermonema sp. TaxID=2231181 RepID=UPI0021DBDE40|nr:pseudouridine synthase [Thermonema sp.]GIV38252.1 MAG: pseudouridine synthase [Thermonema sp.]
MKNSRGQFYYFVVYKPYGVLSQFTVEQEGDLTLACLYDFPPDVYPVGRLDKDSEGLLLLTNDNFLKSRLLSPRFKVEKTYWVQVEGIVTDEAIEQLKQGVSIRLKGKPYQTLPARVARIEAPDLPERVPPIRFRKSVPTSWLSIGLHEGKNRQVRRMTAAVGFPTLRLVRAAVGSLSLSRLQMKEAGEVRLLSRQEIYRAVGVPLPGKHKTTNKGFRS